MRGGAAVPFVAGVFTLVGLFLFFFLPRIITPSLPVKSVQVAGAVDQIEQDGEGMERPVIRYATEAGSSTFTGNVWSSRTAYGVGEAVTVAVDPASPGRAVLVDDKDMVVPQWILKIMGGIFFGIGFVLLLLLARGDDREAISRIGGLLGAWSFGVPATFAFPGLWYAWTHRPNALFRAEDLFGSEQYLIGGIFTVLGLVTLVASLALYRYQARTGLPGWSWSREWRPKE